MADEVTTPTGETQSGITPSPAVNTTPAPAPEKTFTQADVNKFMKEDRLKEREKYADYEALKSAAVELAKIKESQLSETDKLTKKIADLEAEKSQAEARAKAAELARIKTTIGSKLALPTELQDRLRGETEEEIEADAKLLLAAIPKPAPITNTDAASGVNGSQPTQEFSDEQIRAMAADYGVKFEHLKASLIK